MNWIAAHRAVDRPRQRLGQHGLADAGDVLDQQVALGEQHGQGEADDVALALDHRLDRLPDPVGRGASSPSCGEGVMGYCHQASMEVLGRPATQHAFAVPSHCLSIICMTLRLWAFYGDFCG